jgi:hypothetical protein
MSPGDLDFFKPPLIHCGSEPARERAITSNITGG